MKWDSMSRRHFLQGMGMTALTLPLLPSLLSEKVFAQALANTQKNFIGIAAFNGLFRMYGPTSELMPVTKPSGSSLSGFTALDLPGKHRIHSKLLADIASQNSGKISNIVDSSFTPYLSKMLMLQGFDYLSLGWRHHHGHFGNMADSFSGPNNMPPMASIENVMAQSVMTSTKSGFYKNSSLKGNAIAYNANSAERGNYGSSHIWSNPDTKSGEIIYKDPYANPATLWDAYFGNSQGTASTTSLKGTLVDQVYADYQALRSNSRLGAEDKQKIDQHLTLLQETQKRVKSVGAVCNMLRPATSLTDRKLILRTLNDVIVSLIACGRCHSFLGWAHSLISSDPEAWHQWSHSAYDSDTDVIADETAYKNVVDQNRSIMHDMFLDLVVKLDQAGLLDNSLIVWIQEHSKRGHEAWNVPVIMAGSAGGVLKTGQYIDYRSLDSGDDLTFQRLGFPINQLLSNVLQAVDVPASEYEALNPSGYTNKYFASKTGYGHSKFDEGMEDKAGSHYQSWTGHNLSNWLPLIKA